MFPPNRPVTSAQIRILNHLYEYSGAWHTLLELDQCRFLKKDDVVVVPSLVELQLVLHSSHMQAIMISPRGLVLVETLIVERMKRQNP